MKKLIKKDSNNRICLHQNETKRFILKNITKNKSLPIHTRWKALVNLSIMLKNSSSTVFVNRCLLTGRRKRINKLYSFSRIVFLKLARFGYINGLKKSSW